ncbi:MAG: T9SS type A sorting domain-containing protein [Bacteroidetes bacterium]|nr:T9SS type A sorting domain-containing protein [Bacteroidota bacterium]
MRQYLLLFLFSTTLANAQITFNKRYGSGYAEGGGGITVTNDKGFAVVGNTLANGAGGNIFLMKLGQDGSLQWQKDFFGVNDDHACNVYQLANGNYVIGGTTSSYGSGCGDGFILTLDSVGNLIWANAYGDIQCNYVNNIIMTDSSIVGCGSASGSANDGWLFKVNKNGSLLWSKKYIGTNQFTEVRQTLDGGFLAVGSFNPLVILKTDSAGNPVWFKDYGFNILRGQSFEILKNGSAIIVGFTPNTGSIGGESDIFLLKLDPSGNQVWFKQYGFTFFDYGYSVKETKDKGFIVTGYTNSFGHGDWDAFLLKTDTGGNLLWAKTYGDVWADQTKQVQITNDGGFVITGYSSSASNNDSSYVYVVKTDSNGVTTCHYKDWPALQQTQPYPPTTRTITAANFGVDSICNVTVSNYLFTERDFCAMPTGIQSTADEYSFSIYPNPVSSFIQVEGIARHTPLAITNLLGQTLFQTTSETESLTIDVSALPDGFYFLNRHKFIKGQ